MTANAQWSVLETLLNAITPVDHSTADFGPSRHLAAMR
jgi:hypothetical protein